MLVISIYVRKIGFAQLIVNYVTGRQMLVPQLINKIYLYYYKKNTT